ncbi:amidohydrolase family protein [Granulicella mallensis]|uniref:Putative TIM-barrel fold metal-dependent hydrolase n=1 Tax=Granulicella mallensis TaxID=940614 RepID=A0A7W7ZPA5_9BACT|nr:amidohydrolase family protein [Granulicella mallensis]MBB5063645.1 putative TIM-barrel fold metal-dependent hydrolase [Granulicella mallensis]
MDFKKSKKIQTEHQVGLNTGLELVSICVDRNRYRTSKDAHGGIVRCRSLFFPLLVLALSTSPSFARLPSASISGKVTGASQSAIPSTSRPDLHTQVEPDPAKAVNRDFSEVELLRFTALEPIDIHTHIYKSDPLLFEMLRKLHLHTLDIVDVSDNGNAERKDLTKENNDVLEVARESSGHVSVCTTFDPYLISEPGFTEAAIHQLNESFARGAIAVKVWKNVGMEVKDSKGNYILPDNSLLEPIYRDIESHHKTLVTHVGDPNTAWAAPNPSAPDFSYFKNNPQWYMYNIKDAPPKQKILDARDHLLEMNSDLRVVGAHLGSMEADIDQVAQHFDRYPNFTVDLAGRMPYLMLLPREKAIAFITKYQDRLLYGTDNTIYPETEVGTWVSRAEVSYANDWRFLATDQTVEYGGRRLKGLALPNSVVKKIYHGNAVKWIPGIADQ